MTELLCALGLLTHMITVLSEMSMGKKKVVTPFFYIKSRPYKVSLSVIGAIVGYIVLNQMQELTLLTAFGAGYASNDITDRVGKMASGKFK